ncbi:MAG: efflux RND transporter periplasmic adaptor subunit, partial [Pirellulaceae bacterium]
EQSAFDSRLQRETAEAARDDAQRRLDIARQQLRTLLGYDEPLSAEPTSPESPPSASAAQNLSLVETRAPFAGTIESRLVSASERVAQGQTMMVLADTSRLWAVADVREQDWSAVQLRADQELELEFPALPGQSFRGSLYYVGREVVPGTNAIPLVASIDNPSEQLRPGLFVRVALPLEAPREVLAVPAASVVAHEEQSFVFIADAEDSFRRVDVRTGDTNDDWIEITEGVAEGDRVVTGGAFYLKSELLLEREE